MIVGRAPTHTLEIFRKYGCLSTRYLIYTVYKTPKAAGKEYSGFVRFDLCIRSYSVGGRSPSSNQPSATVLSLSLVCSHFPHNCLSLSKILLRQLLSTSSPPSTILFNCTIAIVCRMHSDLVNREKTVCCKM